MAAAATATTTTADEESAVRPGSPQGLNSAPLNPVTLFGFVIHLSIENVIARTECPKTFDVENIVRYTEANKDFGFESAKFCFPIPSRTGSRQVVVNVFASGKIVCKGANTLSRAKRFTMEVLQKLHVSEPFDYSVRHVVMSGYVTGIDIASSADLLRAKSYRVTARDLMRKTDIGDGVVLATFHRSSSPSPSSGNRNLHGSSAITKVVARGPNEKTIRDAVQDICSICQTGHASGTDDTSFA